MADEDDGDAGGVLELAQEFDDAALDDGVEGGGDFVADEHAGAGGEGAGDGGALDFAAGELRGAAAGEGRVELDLPQQLVQARGGGLGEGVDAAQDAGAGMADAAGRVEGGGGMLRDQLDRGAVGGAAPGEAR